jgi:Ser/Thr protein kinase RdoA (MazF antagonist)
MISDEAIRELLRRDWGLADGTRVTLHDGGMGSHTWIVEQGERRWVAKSVAPHLAESFASGLKVALLLGQAGVRAGGPVPARSGSVTVDGASADRMALLTWVPGSPLTGDGEGEQRLIGDTLARVHRVLRDRTVPGAQRFHCGIIDWSSAHDGPLLYDLASAVMYLGGPGRAGPPP